MLPWMLQTTIVTAILACIAMLICRRGKLSPAMQHAVWLLVLLKFLTPSWLAWPWLPESVNVKISSQEFSLPSDSSSSVSEDPVEYETPESSIVPSAVFTEPFLSESEPSLTVQDELEQAGISDKLEYRKNESKEDLIEQTSDATEEQPTEIHSLQNILTEQMNYENSVEESTETHPATIQPISTFEILTERISRHWQMLLLCVWGFGAIMMLSRQACLLFRWRKLVAHAEEPPDWLEAQVQILAARLGVSSPRVRLVPKLPGPVVWCWGRAKLLWPASMSDEQSRRRVRGMIVHELAHLQRRDHWVAWLELAASSLWWWNPLYWYVRKRLRLSADCACDAWVLWALPQDRRVYVESLIEVSSSFSTQATAPASLGVRSQAGRQFERRLSMIVRGNNAHRLSAWTLVFLAALALVILPGWTTGQEKSSEEPENIPVSEQSEGVAAAEGSSEPVETESSVEAVTEIEPLIPTVESKTELIESRPEIVKNVQSDSKTVLVPDETPAPVQPGSPTLVLETEKPISTGGTSVINVESSPVMLPKKSIPQVTEIQVFTLKHREPNEMLRLVTHFITLQKRAKSSSANQPMLNNPDVSYGNTLSVPATRTTQATGVNSSAPSPKPSPSYNDPGARYGYSAPSNAAVPAGAPAKSRRMSSGSAESFYGSYAKTGGRPPAIGSITLAIGPGLRVTQATNQSSIRHQKGVQMLYLTVDTPTNSLIARSTKEVLLRVAGLVEALDVAKGQPLGQIKGQGDVFTINLQYRKAASIVGILKNIGLLGKLQVIHPQIVRSTNPYYYSYRNSHATANLGDKVLIMQGSAKDYEQVSQLIKKLDLPAKRFSSDSPFEDADAGGLDPSFSSENSGEGLFDGSSSAEDSLGQDSPDSIFPTTEPKARRR